MFAAIDPISTDLGIDLFDAPPDTGADAEAWRALAACSTGTGTLAALFFSEHLDDINRAKSLCTACEVRAECLAGATERAEPWGVWGGELFVNGKVIAHKRRRGRPPKVRPADPVVPADPFEGLFPVSAQRTA